jgi:lysophospholipid acyltransferase (LPLAT)-like uncharacterized protein
VGEPSTTPPAFKSRLIGWLGAGFIRLLRSTLRLHHHGDEAMRRREQADERIILAFWHCHLLLMPYSYRGRQVSALLSLHRDGERIEQVVRHFGISAVRGSSTRGGAAALRGALRRMKEGHDLGFTPDGPRGPSKEVKLGVMQAAAMSGAPIQPIALAASRGKRFRSWDRFLLPLPFSRVDFVYGELLWVDREAALEPAALELKHRLEAAEAAAEHWARHGRAPAFEPEGEAA